MIPPCFTLSIIRYVLTVKWSNPTKGVAPPPNTSVLSLFQRDLSSCSRLRSSTFFLYICKVGLTHTYMFFGDEITGLTCFFFSFGRNALQISRPLTVFVYFYFFGSPTEVSWRIANLISLLFGLFVNINICDCQINISRHED